MAPISAQAILSKLSSGVDCEDDVKTFVKTGSDIPDGLVIAAIGDRTRKVPPSPHALRALLEGRGNPNAVDRLTTAPALHAACWHGSVDVVKILLDCRADIECPEPRMKTPPLNTALAAGNAKVCLELLNRLANVQWKHHDGATALHVATAWIASSHNAGLRLPPVGEEPRAVIAMMLHNGVDPLQTEGMTRSTTRGSGMTPLESFRREVAQSPWRSDPQMGERFDQTARSVYTLLEQAEKAMQLKARGNKSFSERKFDEALADWAEARRIWEKADIRGHHTAVLWSNAATCYKKCGDVDKCRNACEEGLKHYSAASIRAKLETTLKECDDGSILEALQAPKPPRPPATQLQEKFLERTPEEKPLYPEGSVQGKVENPGPFICNFEDAKEAGFVDGVPGWRERQRLEEQALDEELVKEGLMSPELLDKP